MEDIELEPGYTTREIAGKCIKCLAEQQYQSCLRELLATEGENEDAARLFEALVSFLTSPDLRRLRDESERHLADGRNVSVVIHLSAGKPEYEVRVKD